MKKLVSRRQLLKRLGAAGSVSLVTSRSASSWDPAILVTGRPVEIAFGFVLRELGHGGESNSRPSTMFQEGAASLARPFV